MHWDGGVGQGDRFAVYVAWDFPKTFGRIGAQSMGLGQFPKVNFLARLRTEPKRSVRMYLDAGGCIGDYPTAQLSLAVLGAAAHVRHRRGTRAAVAAPRGAERSGQALVTHRGVLDIRVGRSAIRAIPQRCLRSMSTRLQRDSDVDVARLARLAIG
jgi:hypothetical protein